MFYGSGSGCGCGNYFPVAGAEYDRGFNFPLIVVLFILLIIIGCSFQDKKPC